MSIKCCLTSCFLILETLFTFGFSQDTLKYQDLVDKLFDLEYLAKIPGIGEYSGNYSSHDRRSKYDETTNTYIHWDANSDGHQLYLKYGFQS